MLVLSCSVQISRLIIYGYAAQWILIVNVLGSWAYDYYLFNTIGTRWRVLRQKLNSRSPADDAACVDCKYFFQKFAKTRFIGRFLWFDVYIKGQILAYCMSVLWTESGVLFGFRERLKLQSHPLVVCCLYREYIDSCCLSYRLRHFFFLTLYLSFIIY